MAEHWHGSSHRTKLIGVPTTGLPAVIVLKIHLNQLPHYCKIHSLSHKHIMHSHMNKLKKQCMSWEGRDIALEVRCCTTLIRTLNCDLQ